ncbi:hypothetical protein MYX84_08640 [Acidobacteria bacterium AH-259-O06]|nr:hypothetical protein [Acidobacteria bacterium AH-259-O06]
MNLYRERMKEFEERARNLPFYDELDYDVEVVLVEPIKAHYSSNKERRRCIVRRKNGKEYVAFYD